MVFSTYKKVDSGTVCFPLVNAGSEEDLLQSADLAILLTASRANGGIGGQVELLAISLGQFQFL